MDTLSGDGSYISVRSGIFSWNVTGFSIVDNIPFRGSVAVEGFASIP